MELPGVAVAALIAAGAIAAAYLYWREVWFWRNPPRSIPAGEGLVAAADGRIVYVKTLAAAEDVIHVKEGLEARLSDIVREDLALPRLLIGIFMSPFDVHFNRAPITGVVEFVRHHPGCGANAHMGAMHRRLLMKRPPYYRDSPHIVRNERMVTKINGTRRGAGFACYVVQIAAKTVAGIDSYVGPGEAVGRGAIFGMIRIGSQVDLVLPWHEGMQVRVRPGDRVRAGETVLVE